jgi:phenylacetate-CoA ligase
MSAGKINPTEGKNLAIGLVGPLPPPPGGMANQTRQLARLLEEEGVCVEVVQVNAPYWPRWIGSIRGVRALFRLVPFLLRLWRAAGRVQMFHVMANSGWAWHLIAAPAVWVAKLRGIPVMVNYRGGDAAEFFEHSFFWVRPTMRMSDQRVVPSGYLQEVFRRFDLSTEIVPNIIDLSRFTPRPANLDPRGGSPHLVVTRHLEPLYDTGTALRAFAFVREKRPDARMTVAGGGPEREMLVALAHELGVAESVTFAGRLDNSLIAELYRDADVFVNASLHDNMPISMLEALACGVPIVSTNVCGIPFLVEHRKSAMLVPPRDAAAMAQAVLDLLENPGFAEQLVRAGWEVAQQYAWSQVRPRLLDVYSRLVDCPVPKAMTGLEVNQCDLPKRD